MSLTNNGALELGLGLLELRKTIVHSGSRLVQARSLDLYLRLILVTKDWPQKTAS
jgi:hypothetical protein